jgi:hypothetical protein
MVFQNGHCSGWGIRNHPIRYNYMFLFNFLVGQNLSTMLKVQIKREEFCLIGGVIHKQSTPTVESSRGFFLSTNQNF